MTANQVRLDLLGIPANVGIARITAAALAAQASFSLPEIEELKVAVSEAVTNAIVHGYRDDPAGIVTIRLSLTDDGVVIVVEDHGVGMEDVTLARQAAFSSDPERMGLGFVFMETFMDALTVESAPRLGTTITMAKRPQSAPRVAADAR